MKKVPQNITLSIVIPLFNGSEFLSDTLDSILSQGLGSAIEVVLCDDVSTDRTFEIAQRYAEANNGIKLFRNAKNIGMDRNFDRIVTHAAGEYVWFCGQDDIIGAGAIEKVLSVLRQDAAVDFIYVNYSQYDHHMSKVISERALPLGQDAVCPDPNSFFAATGMHLPTFLPAYILRKALWDTVDKEPFYGTQYIQLGVFFGLLPRIKSYIIAHPYVRGRVPDTGWQKNNLKVLDIFTGHLEVITYYHRANPELITDKIYRKQFSFCWKNILSTVLRIQMERGRLNEKLSRRLFVIFSSRQRTIVDVLLRLPRPVAWVLYFSAQPAILLYKLVMPLIDRLRATSMRAG